MTRLTTCPDPESAAQRAAQEVLRHLEQARMQGRTPHVALSGGGTPKRTYELLAREPEHWAEAEVWFADERCVPPEHEERNYRLAAWRASWDLSAAHSVTARRCAGGSTAIPCRCST